MPRVPRVDVGGYTYHVLNRATARARIFHDNEDYQTFQNILFNAVHKFSIEIYSYCIMPNHWHIVFHTNEDGVLAKAMQWITVNHTQQWHSRYKTAGSGHIYQGRYKSFIVASDSYLLRLCKYVERNPLTAKLVVNAEDWKWSSLWIRIHGGHNILSVIPIDVPKDYLSWINKDDAIEKNLIEISIKRSRPLGNEKWITEIVEKFKLEVTLRSRGGQRRGT